MKKRQEVKIQTDDWWCTLPRNQLIFLLCFLHLFLLFVLGVVFLLCALYLWCICILFLFYLHSICFTIVLCLCILCEVTTIRDGIALHLLLSASLIHFGTKGRKWRLNIWRRNFWHLLNLTQLNTLDVIDVSLAQNILLHILNIVAFKHLFYSNYG